MVEKDILFKVFRYKQGDKKSHFDEFTVHCDEDTTVLVALQYIRDNIDSSLILRHSCHHSSCGVCGMRINHRENLACLVKVLDLNSSKVVVEPLQNLPVISDLVVDVNPFFEKYNFSEMPYIRESEFLENSAVASGIEKHTRFENCLECGLCNSACPIAGSDSSYLGPSAMAAAWRVVNAGNSNSKKVLKWVDSEHGCWRCHVAYECSSVCPNNVDPAGSIMLLRKTLLKKKISHIFKRKTGDA